MLRFGCSVVLLTTDSECPIYRLVSLGQNIQALLTRQGMDQRELATTLRVAPSSVSDWVNGKTFPRHSRLIAIAEALATSVSDLVGDE